MSHWLERINWKQIFIHALAFWFLMYAFETLVNLFYLDTVGMVRDTYGNTEEISNLEPLWTVKITSYLISVGFTSVGGLILAFFACLFVSRQNRWFWLNTFLSLLLIALLIRLRLTGWSQLKSFFYFPGQLFPNLFIEFLINGIILLSFGLFFLFSASVKQFITGRPKTT